MSDVASSDVEMLTSPDLDRKYQPPPPSADAQTHAQGRMTKDDLHQWSIYRQNLTSTIAESLLAPLVGVRGSGPLPYGNFQMHDQSIESVLQQGRQDDYLLGDKGDIYLKFGLPRVALQKGEQQLNRRHRHQHQQQQQAHNYKPYRQPLHQSQLLLLQQQQLQSARRTQSEMDVRRAVLDASTGRGPYLGTSKFSGSLENGMDLLGITRATNSPMPHYAQSDIADGPSVNHVFDPSEFRRRQIMLPSVGAPMLSPPGPSYMHDAQLGPGAFLQGKRHHHSQYFSNLDLFTSSNPYNYLRYVKSDELQSNVAKQPNLVARNVGFELDVRTNFEIAMLRSPSYKRILDNLSFDIYGGETMAIMYTSEEEISTLLSLLANVHRLRGRTEGTFLVNGLPLRGKDLGDRIGYVCSQDLYPNLTVREHLRMTSSLLKPATNAFRRNSMISQLIQTLALAPFHDRLIGELGRTEKQRVKVACQILLDTDIIVLDNVSKDMDLYDSAFLIDYLRDWASKLSRIVIMAVNPPTYEMLAMFSKTAILASGRFIYFGQSQQMLNYFDSLNFACPLFKNPCDYYIDLFTHDHLRIEDSIESRDRVKRFADFWLQKAPPLFNDCSLAGVPPPRVYRANPFSAIFLLYYRFWLILFNCPWHFVREIFYALIMSLVIGTVFYQLTSKQAGINDRLGLFYYTLTFGILPNLCLNIERVFHDRQLIFVDSMHNVYSKFSFFTAKILFDFPLAMVVYCVYAAPLYFMTKLQAVVNDQGYAFGIYMGLVVLYASSFRMLSWAAGYCLPKKFLAASVLAIFLAMCALTAGVTCHPNDTWLSFSWFRYASATAWLQQILSQHEFVGNLTQLDVSSPEAFQRPVSTLLFECYAKEVKYGPIVTRLPCPVNTGEEALKFANLTFAGVRDQNMTYYVGIPVVAGYGLIGFLLSFAFLHCNYKPLRKLRHREC